MPKKRHRGGHEEEHENHERWLVSYADMITVLMAFFIMLYGISILDLKKFEDFKEGLQDHSGGSPVQDGGAGLLVAGTGIVGPATPPVGPGERVGGEPAARVVRGEATREDIEALMGEVTERLSDVDLEHRVTVDADPRGLIVYLPDEVLFGSGAALISIEGQQLLAQVAEVLRHIDNTFLVEGHTDNVPTTGTRWASNWELSTARATNVLRHLVEHRGIPAARAGASGYADMRPRVANDTPEHRAMNRRVEIVIIIREGAHDGQEEV